MQDSHGFLHFKCALLHFAGNCSTWNNFRFRKKQRSWLGGDSFVVRGRVPQGGLQSAGAHLRDSMRVDAPAFQEVSQAEKQFLSHLRGRI
jgi:hypothetical protein